MASSRLFSLKSGPAILHAMPKQPQELLLVTLAQSLCLIALRDPKAGIHAAADWTVLTSSNKCKYTYIHIYVCV